MVYILGFFSLVELIMFFILALKDNDFILAKELCEELEKQVKLLRS